MSSSSKLSQISEVRAHDARTRLQVKLDRRDYRQFMLESGLSDESSDADASSLSTVNSEDSTHTTVKCVPLPRSPLAASGDLNRILFSTSRQCSGWSRGDSGRSRVGGEVVRSLGETLGSALRFKSYVVNLSGCFSILFALPALQTARLIRGVPHPPDPWGVSAPQTPTGGVEMSKTVIIYRIVRKVYVARKDLHGPTKPEPEKDLLLLGPKQKLTLDWEGS